MTSLPPIGKSFRLKKHHPEIAPTFTHFKHMKEATFTAIEIYQNKYYTIKLQCSVCNKHCVIDLEELPHYFYSIDALKIKETPTYLEL